MILLEFLNRHTDGKMPFNSDISKQAQEVLFSKKTTKINHTNIIYQRLCCFYKILKNQHQLIFTVHFLHQKDIIIHVPIAKLDKF